MCLGNDTTSSVTDCNALPIENCGSLLGEAVDSQTRNISCQCAAPEGFSVHYNFDDSYVNHGTYHGDDEGALALHQGAIMTVNQSFSGLSLQLDTENSFASIGSNINNNTMSGPTLLNAWTMTIWFKNLNPDAVKRTLYRGFTLHHPFIVDASGVIGAYDNYQGFILTTVNIDNVGFDGKWHHLALVGHDGVEDVYVDGAFLVSISYQGHLDMFSIGNYRLGKERFAEYLDEFYLYLRVLNSTELTAIFNEGKLLSGMVQTCSGEQHFLLNLFSYFHLAFVISACNCVC